MLAGSGIKSRMVTCLETKTEDECKAEELAKCKEQAQAANKDAQACDQDVEKRQMELKEEQKDANDSKSRMTACLDTKTEVECKAEEVESCK